MSSGQLTGLDVVVLPLESVVVVVYWQTGVQFTFVLVAPVTVAVNVVDWPRIKFVPEEEEIATVMTLAAPPPPQPLDSRRQAAASPAPRKLETAPNFLRTDSPTYRRLANVSACVPDICFSQQFLHANLTEPVSGRHAQKVRLTVKRNVVFGSK